MKKFGGSKKAMNATKMPKMKDEPKKAVMKAGKGKRGKYVEDHYGGVPIR